MWNFIKDDLKEFVDSVSTDIKQLTTKSDDHEEGYVENESFDPNFAKKSTSSSSLTSAATHNSESDKMNKKSSSSNLVSSSIAKNLPNLATLDGFDNSEEEAGGWDNEVNEDSEKNSKKNNVLVLDGMQRLQKEDVQINQLSSKAATEKDKVEVGKINETKSRQQNVSNDHDPSLDIEVIKTADIQFLLATKEHDLALLRSELNIMKEKLRSQVSLYEQVVQENHSLKEIVRKQQHQIEMLQEPKEGGDLDRKESNVAKGNTPPKDEEDNSIIIVKKGEGREEDENNYSVKSFDSDISTGSFEVTTKEKVNERPYEIKNTEENREGMKETEFFATLEQEKDPELLNEWD